MSYRQVILSIRKDYYMSKHKSKFGSGELEELLNKAVLFIEVAKNSCFYQDNYAEGEVLGNAINYLYDVQDILLEAEYKS